MGRRADPGGSRDGAVRAGTIYAGQPLHFLHPIGVGDTITVTGHEKDRRHSLGGDFRAGTISRLREMRAFGMLSLRMAAPAVSSSWKSFWSLKLLIWFKL